MLFGKPDEETRPLTQTEKEVLEYTDPSRSASTIPLTGRFRPGFFEGRCRIFRLPPLPWLPASLARLFRLKRKDTVRQRMPGERSPGTCRFHLQENIRYPPSPTPGVATKKSTGHTEGPESTISEPRGGLPGGGVADQKSHPGDQNVENPGDPRVPKYLHDGPRTGSKQCQIGLFNSRETVTGHRFP